MGRLIFIDCRIDGVLKIEDATLGVLLLDGSRVRGVMANRAVFTGSVFLQNGFRSTGTVSMFGARVGGGLQATGGRITVEAAAAALVCTGAEISGNVMLDGVFKAKGKVWLNRARIGGDVDCRGARLASPAGQALVCDGAVIGGSLRLDRARVVGGVGAKSVKISGELDATDASLVGALDSAGARGWAMDATSAGIGRSVVLAGSVPGGRRAGRFKATGGVSLASAEIGGDFAAPGGVFLRRDGVALDLSAARVRGSALLTQAMDGGDAGNRFEARGAVSLYAATIDGHLNCQGGLFTVSLGPAINGEILEVGGCVYLTGPDIADAERNPALAPFQSEGEVMLHAAQIGMQLSCLGGEMTNTVPDSLRKGAAGVALNIAIAKVGYQMLLGPAEDDDNRPARIRGSIDFTGAAVGGLYDRGFVGPEGPGAECCPATVAGPDGRLLRCETLLDGFTYGRLDSDADVGLVARRAWLMRQPTTDSGDILRGQPFDHLATALEAMGHGAAALDIRVLKEERITRTAPVADKVIAVSLLVVVVGLLWNGRVWPALGAIVATMLIATRGRHGKRSAEWLWRRILGWVVAYGYRPGRGLAVALAIALVCGAYYQQAELKHALARSGDKATAGATPFHPYVYSLDVMLPVAKLGEAEAWKPTGRGFALRGRGDLGRVEVDAAFTQKVVWLETAFGWLAGGILVALVSGLVKKRGQGD